MKVLVVLTVELTARERDLFRRRGCVSRRDLKQELTRRAGTELRRDIDEMVRIDGERHGAHG